jgi:hypothetical protein
MGKTTAKAESLSANEARFGLLEMVVCGTRNGEAKPCRWTGDESMAKIYSKLVIYVILLTVVEKYEPFMQSASSSFPRLSRAFLIQKGLLE